MSSEDIPRLPRCCPNVSIRITGLHKKKSKLNTSSFSSSSYSSSSRSFSLTPRGRTKEDELRDVFRHFDIDEDGKISALELLRYFTSIGEVMSLEDAQEVIHELDSNKDGKLDFPDFVKLMDTKDGAEEDLKKVFEVFEYEKGSGRITPSSLQRAFSRLGDSKSYQECVAMIQVYDVDGDGELDFNEFHQMMAA